MRVELIDPVLVLAAATTVCGVDCQFIDLWWSGGGHELNYSVRAETTGINNAVRTTVNLSGRTSAAAPAPSLHTAWSPNDGRIAYPKRVEGEMGMSYEAPDGEERFAAVGFLQGRPTWSPRGDRIAFVADINVGVVELFVLDAATGLAQRVTYNENTEEFPTWSPDQESIAVAMRARGGSRRIFVVDIDDASTRQVTWGDYDGDPSWSPDCSRLAYVSSTGVTGYYEAEIYVVELENLSTARLTENAAYDGMPRWSPTGRDLFFASCRDGRLGIYSMSAEGGAVRQVIWCDD